MLNRSALLIAFLATLAAIVLLVIATPAELGGRLDVVEALTGLLLIEGGAIAGAQIPTPPAPRP